MRGKPGQDYLADFATIGAKPGCSPSELEAAWRRRVSDLHPDRPQAGDPDGDAGQRQLLAEINGAYRRLRHFQRRHGRMPGSVPAPGEPERTEQQWERDHRQWHGPARPTWLLALFNASLLALLAVLVWLALERLGIRDHDGPGGRRADVTRPMTSPGPWVDPAHHRAPLRNSTTSTV